MIRDRYQPVDVFAQVPALQRRTDPILAHLDSLVDDEVLFAQVKAAMSRRREHSLQRGRPSTPAEVVLRLLIVRRLYHWSFAETVERVADSLVLRHFCRVYWQSVPDGSTLERWEQVIGTAPLGALQERVVMLAQQAQVTRGRKLRVDGTVVETAIHYPSDSSLLADGVRVLSRLLGRAKTLLGAPGGAVYRNRTRSARRLARQIGETVRRRGKEAERLRQRRYERLLAVARATLRQVEQVREQLPAGSRVGQDLAHYAALTARVVQQTGRRLAGEQVPASEKVVSLFEEHSAILVRKQAQQQTAFGHRVILGESEGGILTSVQIVPGTEQEAGYLAPAVREQARLLGRMPDLVAADRAFWGQQVALDQLGVRQVVIPRQGQRPEAERSRAFRRGQRFRAGIEGRISVCKRRGWLGRCPAHGWAGFCRWIGWGVLTANLVTLARAQAARAGG